MKNVVYLHNGILRSCKKKIKSFGVNGTGRYHMKKSKEGHRIISFICGRENNLKENNVIERCLDHP